MLRPGISWDEPASTGRSPGMSRAALRATTDLAGPEGVGHAAHRRGPAEGQSVAVGEFWPLSTARTRKGPLLVVEASADLGAAGVGADEDGVLTGLEARIRPAAQEEPLR